MSTDWNSPIAADDTDDVLDGLKSRDVDALTLCVADPTNKPTGAIRWNRSTFKFQEWDGAAWQNMDVASGLTLGTMASQNSNAITITGGTVTGVAAPASIITSGLLGTARLGTGTPSAYTPLFGDQTWKETGIGCVSIWLVASIPAGYLLLNGQAVSRTTYASLFTLWGTVYGTGDGSTTFNVTDMRGFFPFAKPASGTGSVLGATFGLLDHIHAYTQIVNHTHSVTITDGGHSHSISDPGHTHNIDRAASAGGGTQVFERVSNAGSTDNQSTLSATTGIGVSSAVTGISAVTTNPGGGGASGTTQAANPPGFSVNFIVKAL